MPFCLSVLMELYSYEMDISSFMVYLFLIFLDQAFGYKFGFSSQTINSIELWYKVEFKS